MRVTVFVVALVLLVSGDRSRPGVGRIHERQGRLQNQFPRSAKGDRGDLDVAAELHPADACLQRREGAASDYSLTVVDYSGIEQQGIERAKTCPPGNANCRANAPPALGPGYSHHDERGAIVYATFKLLQRDAKLNYMAWEWQDMVEGHLLQLTNADQSRTFAWIGMHAHKLYIVEGTVPAGYPEPGLFQQSLGWVDKDGNGIRYQTIYSNSYHGMGVYPVPTVAGRGRGAGGGAANPAGRGNGRAQ